MGLVHISSAPDEVKRAFNEYADVLEIYANDQVAMLARGFIGKTERKARIAVLLEVVKELREIECRKEA